VQVDESSRPSEQRVDTDARAHYDRFPYEVGVNGEDYLASQGALGEFLRSIGGGIAVDVGCGPGNLIPALTARASSVVAIDLSEVSLRLASALSQGRAAVVHGTALALPLRDDCADIVVATGSLHHTGDAASAFRELSRVLRPGGRSFIALYAAGSYYERLYRTVGRAARRFSGSSVGDVLVNRCLLMPAFALYFIAGRAVAHRRLALPSWRQIRNYFADQLLNPVVSFHSDDQVRDWVAACGLREMSISHSHAGALMQMVVVKPPDHAPAQAGTLD